MIQAVIFDCFGVLYEQKPRRGLTKTYGSNEPLIEVIRYTLKPRYKIGLLSDTHREWMENFLTTYQLHDVFDVVVVSAEEGITKADPRIFERTAQKLGVASEACMLIDDSARNCETAQEVGMKTLLYTEATTPKMIINHIHREDIHA